MSVDLSQLALYDGGGGSIGALTFDDKDTIGPSPSQLTEEEARLAHTYHNASDIDADVSALQANINDLIENMGFDSAPLTATLPHPHSHSHPSLSSAGGEAPAGADFDFDAFLTAFASEQDGVSVPLPLPALGSVSGADTNAAEAGIAKVLADDRPVVRRRGT
ncbi:hypothetical protein EDB85DRAFT_875297 [Lactarius pseudohatsudake]|nr:hypothetical protein EDB85DRAFT_875297 [Lactarius pseudohatsudake]